MAREIRLDRGRLAKAKRTAQGFARVDARLTRTGILEYTRADGTIQREYRSADEVFKADSLKTLELVTVTDLHPSVMVDATNAQQLSVGVTSEPRQDGKFVAAVLTIQHAPVIAKIDAGDREEISCGYTCELDDTPGEFEGQRYDAVQRNIQYNHVAIGPRNWGRAGSDVAMRLDGKDSELVALTSRFDSEQDDDILSRDNHARKDALGARLMTIKIGDVELKLDERDAAIVSAELKRLNARADAADVKANEQQAAAGKAAVELATMKQRTDAAEARVAKLDRADLESCARVALGAEFKFDGKTDIEVKAAVVAKMLPTMRMDSTDAAFVNGAYHAALDLAQKADKERLDAARASGGGGSGATLSVGEQARLDMIQANRDAASAK